MTNPSFTLVDIRDLARAEHDAARSLLSLARHFERLGRTGDAADAHADCAYHWARFDALRAALDKVALGILAA